MSRVSGESVNTLPRGYYIGWHPRIIRGCPEYPGNPWILCQGGVLYRLTSTDSPGMSIVFRESVDTLPRGYYIGWHPRIVRGCPEYPGNPWILCQGGVLYRLASTDSPGMSRVSRESVDTLPRGYYIGWHPRIVRGCP